jgi:hypothetical protein
VKKGRMALGIALIVASTCCFSLEAAEPPPGLLRKIAERETANSQAMTNYTYRQSVTVQEFNDRGGITGEYHEVRDIVFSPNHVRYEQAAEKPRNTLLRIKLTPLDFEDIRNIQPFLLTTDKVSLYEGQYKGEQTINGTLCFVEHIRPRQILSGQRFFEGLLWVRESDFAVIQTEGQGVPQIQTLREQNLTPHFTTIRKSVDNQWWFPTETYADDTLFFRDWPQHIRIEIRYLNYKRFGAESTVTFGGEQPPQTNTPPPQTPPNPNH